MPPRRHNSAGFSIVDVMMGATILVVGLMGLIQAVTIGSEMLATARRETLAAQIIDHEIETLRFADWSTISSLTTTGSTPNLPWSASRPYAIGETTIRSGNWYRCITANTGQGPPNSTYWKIDAPPFAGLFTNSAVAHGATYALSRTVANVSGATNLREVTFTITWQVTPSGFTTSRIYTRKKSAYFGKYGLNLTFQRS